MASLCLCRARLPRNGQTGVRLLCLEGSGESGCVHAAEQGRKERSGTGEVEQRGRTEQGARDRWAVVVRGRRGRHARRARREGCARWCGAYRPTAGCSPPQYMASTCAFCCARCSARSLRARSSAGFSANVFLTHVASCTAGGVGSAEGRRRVSSGAAAGGIPGCPARPGSSACGAGSEQPDVAARAYPPRCGSAAPACGRCARAASPPGPARWEGRDGSAGIGTCEQRRTPPALHAGAPSSHRSCSRTPSCRLLLPHTWPHTSVFSSITP